MRKKILLINPPIYDFSAYDFWLKPYGLLRVGGFLRNSAELELFDFLDRFHPSVSKLGLRHDHWGRGRYLSQPVEKPIQFSGLPRQYRRYGVAVAVFRQFLANRRRFDAVLIQTSMTYWYPGVVEVIKTVRETNPNACIVLGGTYATLCPSHASALGADLVVEGCNLEPLWTLLGVEPERDQPPLWESYGTIPAGVLKLAEGCPFRCTYCSVPNTAPNYRPHSLQKSWQAFRFLSDLGTRNIAFYDDALLFKPEECLKPFLRRVAVNGYKGYFHTPNALNARFLSRDLATLLVQTGFNQFYLGFESSADDWQRKTGGKVSNQELEMAVDHLSAAGADRSQITAYLIVGHPENNQQELESSMALAHRLGIRIMLSEFSPIPGTPDGEKCRNWVDLDEPLFHNKTAFTQLHLGSERLQALKDKCKQLNAALGHSMLKRSFAPFPGSG